MEILKFPHPSLFIKCRPVVDFGPKLKDQLEAMYKIMLKANGIGLAANQVGLDKRMFVMECDGEKLFVVNPNCYYASPTLLNVKESCLSAPGEFVTRSDRRQVVALHYQDENGVSQAKVFSGLESICVQHEMEHLEGRVFWEWPTVPKGRRKILAKKWGLK